MALLTACGIEGECRSFAWRFPLARPRIRSGTLAPQTLDWSAQLKAFAIGHATRAYAKFGLLASSPGLRPSTLLGTTLSVCRRVGLGLVARYNTGVITRGIREFVARDWSAVRESKDLYWSERIGRLGAAEGFRIADELRRQALQLDPSWPGDELRRADLQAHVRLAALLRRADSARRR